MEDNVSNQQEFFSIQSRGAESWWGCFDSDSGSDSGLLIDSDSGSDSGILIDSDSGSDSDSGPDTNIRTT